MASTQAPASAARPSLSDIGLRMGFVPWRRYFARVIDLGITGVAVYALLDLWASMIAPPDIDPDSWTGVALVLRYILDMFLLQLSLSFLVGIVFNAVWLRLTGTTPGKFVFGIRVHEQDGSRLSLGRAFSRELRVWMQGLFFGIPILDLLAMAAAYGYLEVNGDTLWDRRMALKVRYRESTPLQRALWIVAIFLIFFGADLIASFLNR